MDRIVKGKFECSRFTPLEISKWLFQNFGTSEGNSMESRISNGVEKWDIKKDGHLSDKALRKKIEVRGFNVSKYIYPPGTYFPDHTHEVDKIDAVLSGRFKMCILGKEVILEAGDCLYVAKGTVHSAEVVGTEPVISLDAVKD